MAEVYTLKEWLRGMTSDFDIADTTMTAVLISNGVCDGLSYAEASEKQRDLTLADLYMFLATSSSKTGSIYDADGGWQKGRATKNVIDRAWFKARANELYEKWDSPKATNAGKMVMRNLY